MLHRMLTVEILGRLPCHVLSSRSCSATHALTGETHCIADSENVSRQAPRALHEKGLLS